MTAEQVAAVLGLDQDDGPTVRIQTPEERPFVPIVPPAKAVPARPPAEVLM